MRYEIKDVSLEMSIPDDYILITETDGIKSKNICYIWCGKYNLSEQRFYYRFISIRENKIAIDYTSNCSLSFKYLPSDCQKMYVVTEKLCEHIGKIKTKHELDILFDNINII